MNDFRAKNNVWSANLRQTPALGSSETTPKLSAKRLDLFSEETDSERF